MVSLFSLEVNYVFSSEMFSFLADKKEEPAKAEEEKKEAIKEADSAKEEEKSQGASTVA